MFANAICGRLRRAWQHNRKLGSAIGTIGGANLAAVCDDDAVTNCQTQSNAATTVDRDRRTAEKLVEDFGFASGR